MTAILQPRLRCDGLRGRPPCPMEGSLPEPTRMVTADRLRYELWRTEGWERTSDGRDLCEACAWDLREAQEMRDIERQDAALKRRRP